MDLKNKRVCVICGSSDKINSAFKNSAKDLGKILAENNSEVIYGGGNNGLMGILADSVIANSGKITGIIPEFLKNKNLAHNKLTDLQIVEKLHEREHIMLDNSDVVIALPGSVGTISELFQAITRKQLRINDFEIYLLNIDNYYDNLIFLLNNMIEENFLFNKIEELITIVNSVQNSS